MQIRADLTKEELFISGDPLHYTCHPLGKIKLVSDMLCVLHFDADASEELFDRDNLYTLYSILNDAKKEIEFVVDVCNERWNKDLSEKRELMERVHQNAEATQGETAENIANDYGVSVRTIYEDGKYAKAVDTVSNLTDNPVQAKNQILSGKKKLDY